MSWLAPGPEPAMGTIMLSDDTTGVWMDAHLTFNKQHYRYMKKAMAADVGLRTHTDTYGACPGGVRAVQVTCIQAVTVYGIELWRNPREVGRRDDLQLLLNWQSSLIIGVLPMTPRGALIKESGLPPAPLILDSRQQRLAARLDNACGCKLMQLHMNPSSGAPIW